MESESINNVTVVRKTIIEEKNETDHENWNYENSRNENYSNMIGTNNEIMFDNVGIDTPVANKISQLVHLGPTHYTKAIHYAAATVPQLNNTYERMKNEYILDFDISSEGHELEMYYAKKNLSGYSEYPRHEESIVSNRTKKYNEEKKSNTKKATNNSLRSRSNKNRKGNNNSSKLNTKELQKK